MFKHFDYLKHQRMVYIIKEHAYIQAKLGVAIGFGSSSLINNLDEILGYESLPSSRVHSIEDGALMRRDREVIDFTRSRVKNNTELTNLGN